MFYEMLFDIFSIGKTNNLKTYMKKLIGVILNLSNGKFMDKLCRIMHLQRRAIWLHFVVLWFRNVMSYFRYSRNDEFKSIT